MRCFVSVSAMLLGLGACASPSSPAARGIEEQPVYPLHVHPSLSGAPWPVDARAPGRGTRGALVNAPFFTPDYPDPPMLWSSSQAGPEALATGPDQAPQGKGRTRARGQEPSH